MHDHNNHDHIDALGQPAADSLTKESTFVLSDAERDAIEHENITMKMHAPHQLKR